MKFIVGILIVIFSLTAATNNNHGLFTSSNEVQSRNIRATSDSAADIMARNILEWIQNIYQTQSVRKARQQSDNAYLPPYSTQRPPEKPRPFQPATSQEPPYSAGGQYTPSNNGYSSSPVSTSRPSYTPNVQTSFSSTNGYPYTPRPSPPFSDSNGYPATSTTYLPPANGGYPSGEPRPMPGFPSPQPGRPGPGPRPQPGPDPGPEPQPGPGPAPGPQPGPGPRPQPGPGPAPGPEPRPQPGPGPAPGPGPRPQPGPAPGPGPEPRPQPGPGPAPGPRPQPGPGPGPRPQPGPGPAPGPGPEPQPGPRPQPGPGPAPRPGPGIDISPGGGNTGPGVPPDDDLNHPPHIHALDVQCSKSMMTINIEFNRAYDGIIYSKGFYMMPNCRYVEANSKNTKYSFTVNLDSCGTQFINDFEGEAGQAYLENVLVLQNEAGIQEVWDTVRRVRCLWEGNINKALTVSLSVDMLNQEIVTFSGDTASAKLDIQIGKGPFAPAANGLVKIGEVMTLVISVEGDPDFDLQVRDCVARDDTSTNLVQLTDERGCILKPKIFGAFQKTKDTGNTGASIIAYAFFQAFKFPDVMDLFIECNVELCKTNCDACPEPNQQIDPGRRRRSITSPLNSTISLAPSGVRVGRGFRVVMPEDLSPMANQALENVDEEIVQEIASSNNVCLSNSGFYVAFSMMFTAVVSSTISAVILYSKLQNVYKTKAYSMGS
ncbi:uncharacterized protein LOC127290738 [Leptopilina boulardi]|uniref:uncharacterized protein LOC127290738 n=1 Tax=Leptopilina boulardi TaxID=63433 RepID=UPI0021F55BD9|nr:uncharacterized protein LOC127290738 [Leptopilina boulardi]